MFHVKPKPLIEIFGRPEDGVVLQCPNWRGFQHFCGKDLVYDSGRWLDPSVPCFPEIDLCPGCGTFLLREVK
jgi:hypothetical protein